MSEIPDIKNGELLEIYTRLPFRNLPKESSTFLLLENEWNFYFTMDGSDHDYEAYLQLTNKKTEYQQFEIDYEIGFKNDQESFSFGTTPITNESDSHCFWAIDERDLDVPLDYNSGNILLFKLRFQFQVEPVLNHISKLEHKSVQTSPYMDVSFLMDSTTRDFLKLFQESFCHDVKLICGDESIKAHKGVLCCRSDVFASKFEGEGENTYEVKMENIDSSIFQQFLEYIYTGVFPDLALNNAIKLYEAAFEYSVDGLKKLCASFLTENLSPDNAVEILKIADRHNDSDFKNFVKEYITEEIISQMGDKWFHFCKENPALACEILNLCIQKPRAKKPRLS